MIFPSYFFSPSRAAREGDSSIAAESPAKQKASPSDSKSHLNFPPWEKPANAVVAGFPYGPGEPTTIQNDAPEPSMKSWAARWKNSSPRAKPQRPLREDGTPHRRMKIIALHMRLPVVRTQLLDVDVDALQKVVWDVEDNSEEQLDAILADAVQDEGGLFHCRGKMLQFATEGGGYFDPRRPPFYGTWLRTSTNVTGRTPCGKDPELDYDYESDLDWESEAGDGEDLGSDMGDDEEEEDEEEEGGFVVPDCEWAPEDAMEGGQKKVKKLTQIIYDAGSMPPEMADLFAVRVLTDVPIVLSRDKNMILEENYDYEGCDVGMCKVSDLETALWKMHQHPTACSFTYIPSSIEHRYSGFVFLKNSDAPGGKFCSQGMVSGYIMDVSESKLIAIEKARLEEIAAEEKAAKEAEQAAQKAAWEEFQRKAAASRPPPAARKEKPLPENEMSRELLVALVTAAHGCPQMKSKIVEAVHIACDIPKSTASSILGRVCSKKEQRWRMNAAFIEAKDLAEAVEAAWEKNSQEPIPLKEKSKAAAEEEEKEAHGQEDPSVLEAALHDTAS